MLQFPSFPFVEHLVGISLWNESPLSIRVQKRHALFFSFATSSKPTQKEDISSSSNLGARNHLPLFAHSYLVSHDPKPTQLVCHSQTNDASVSSVRMTNLSSSQVCGGTKSPLHDHGDPSSRLKRNKRSCEKIGSQVYGWPRVRRKSWSAEVHRRENW